MEEKKPDIKYLIPDKAYQWLKWIGLVGFPALSTSAGIVLISIDAPSAAIVVTVLNSIGLSLGGIIGVSAIDAKKKG